MGSESLGDYFFFAGKAYNGAYVLPRTKKKLSLVLSRSEVFWYFSIPEREREREQERTRERGGERERERERTQVQAILFLNHPGQNEKSAKYMY